MQYIQWRRKNNVYHHSTGLGTTTIQHYLLGFNIFTGKIIFRSNNYGLFSITEKNAQDVW
jgi:hypothetical protein